MADHTPRRYRFWLVAGTIAAVLGLHLVGKPPGETLLAFIGPLVLAYLGASQWGQVKRTVPTPPVEPKPPVSTK